MLRATRKIPLSPAPPINGKGGDIVFSFLLERVGDRLGHSAERGAHLFFKHLYLMNQSTINFIRRHADENVRQLALQASRDTEVDMPFALDQISGRQTARRKLPSWAAVDGIVYPPYLNMEQCSSEGTARYKADLAKRLMGSVESPVMADLTGGFGVDCSFLARAFSRAVYVERDERLCALAEHNFRLLGKEHIEVRNADSIAFLDSMSPVDLIFMDPARRDDAGRRVFFLSDCQPDVCRIEEQLLSRCRVLLLKLSPMLDWHQAVRALDGPSPSGGRTAARRVREVHIVSVGNECRELLLVVSARSEEPLCVHCVNDGQAFIFTPSETESQAVPVVTDVPSAGMYLFEPNASVMKGGCFASLAARYPVEALADNTRLFVSRDPLEQFPGRQFRIEAVSTLNKRDLRLHLSELAQANLAVRNFPMTVEALRQRLHLKDGGDTYLFATTVGRNWHGIIVCKKLH